ncbi:MAG: Druantia anti-phage system protein DruA [bacterium]
MDTQLVIRGRRITSNDITFIRSVIKEHQARGRTFISEELCRLWDWRQRNGMFKSMACRELLLRLERAGLVELPARKSRPKASSRRHNPIQIPLHSQEPIMAPLAETGPIEIKMVRGTQWEPLYKGLIHAYHYLGYCQTVGEHLKYIAFHKDRPLACIGWGAAAWKVGCRDRFIGWSWADRDRNLHLIVQNTRFLILPWVRVPYLASHLLGRMAKILPQEWQRIYNHTIVLLETFVDTSRFLGTCYKAANWIHTGFTQGRGKWDIHKKSSAPVKTVWLYPLVKNFQEILTRHD